MGYDAPYCERRYAPDPMPVLCAPDPMPWGGMWHAGHLQDDREVHRLPRFGEHLPHSLHRRTSAPRVRTDGSAPVLTSPLVCLSAYLGVGADSLA